MGNQEFDSVWDALEDTPEQAENMKLRSALMQCLSEYIRQQNLTGTEAGRRLGLTQPRVSYLMNGKIQKFSLDALVTIASRAGFHVEMKVAPVGKSAA
ncbi:XRE family transcriptional regulator [Alcanivorax sp. JB21]|uniref:helix-turn-helix domain-containing protein n=1 Tax=Alcanivorax limicola TaxID=2874102 RepID=UPI001CBFB814|nr:XRE family transcriptional regulator [Alcanivorax limicola]MBZ2190117.1 XRE family transcriptional regulator [Alcanivorax limicola]